MTEAPTRQRIAADHPSYKWVALSNTTLGILIATINSSIGVLGTIWSYLSLHETGVRRRGGLDLPGNLTFAVGLTALLVAITYGIQPYGGSAMGWGNPWVVAGIVGGIALLVVFCVIETRTLEPMFATSLFRIRPFWAGNLAGLLSSISRGGMQFMLII